MTTYRTGITKALGYAGLACGLLLFAPTAEAQQTKSSGSTGAATPAPLSPADSAACVQVINYAFTNPEVMQKSQDLKANSSIKAIGALPDSVRRHIAKAIENGHGDTLKAMARQLLDPKTAPTLDPFIDFVVSFPDSIRNAIGTLVTSGRSMTCS